MNRGRLAIFLALTSITIAEFVTGATPLTKIVTDPGSFFFFSIPTLFGIYGCGVILIREATVAWGKGWPTILMLGIAYGILEEGVAAHTFFDPVNSTVGIFGSYGRVLGVNTTWAIEISIFHAAFSIALPILFSRLIWPGMNNFRITGRKGIITILSLYLFTLTVLDPILPHRPPFIYSVALFASAGILTYLSRRVPNNLFAPGKLHRGGINAKLLIAGLLFFPFIVALPRLQTALPPVILNVELILGSVVAYWFIITRIRGKSPRASAVLAIGLTAPMMLFGLVVDLTRNPLGIVAIFALICVELVSLRASKTNYEYAAIS